MTDSINQFEEPLTTEEALALSLALKNAPLLPVKGFEVFLTNKDADRQAAIDLYGSEIRALLGGEVDFEKIEMIVRKGEQDELKVLFA